jgi:hypothetical protein
MDVSQICADYESATLAFEKLVDSLSADQLDLKKGDGWSARQVIHHMADSEAQSYARLRRLIAEPDGSIIQGYDEGAWAECATLGYTELPIEKSLAVFKAVRVASLDILQRLNETDFAKYGTHTESGKYTLENWINSYSKHPKDHGNQIIEAIGK